MVLSEEENIRGLPVMSTNYEDFQTCIESCDLIEVQFKRNPYTWWNGRSGKDCSFERLDRALINSFLQEIFPLVEIEHCPRTGLDHAPLLIVGEGRRISYKKPFRFQNF